MVDLSKIFIAKLWTADDFNKAPELQSILDSGLLAQSSKLQEIVNRNDAGFQFDLPYVDEPDYSEPSIMDDSMNLIPTQDFSWDSQTAAISLYARSYQYSNFAVEVGRDSDPAKVVKQIIGNYWGRDVQRRMIAILKAISANAPTLQLDVADDTTDGADVLLDSTVIIDAISKQGDNQDKFNYIFMHSKVYSDLKKKDLIDMILPSNNTSLNAIPFYGKYRVIVNDLMPVIQGTNKVKYMSIIGQSGLFAYANKALSGNIPPLEPYRDPRTGNGGGDTQIIARRGFVLHPLGWSWNYTGSNLSPTIAELSDGANWIQKFEDKQQRFVSIITN